MIQYIIRRLLSSIPVLIGILLVTFALARLIPGDPCTALLGENATPQICAQFIHRYGLDQPIYIQFGSSSATFCAATLATRSATAGRSR